MKPLHFVDGLLELCRINAETLRFFSDGNNVVGLIENDDGVVEDFLHAISDRLVDYVIIWHKNYVSILCHASHFIIWTELFTWTIFSKFFGKLMKLFNILRMVTNICFSRVSIKMTLTLRWINRIWRFPYFLTFRFQCLAFELLCV